MEKKAADLQQIVSLHKERINYQFNLIEEKIDRVFNSKKNEKITFSRCEKLGTDAYNHYQKNVKILHEMIMSLNTAIGNEMSEIEQSE